MTLDNEPKPEGHDAKFTDYASMFPDEALNDKGPNRVDAMLQRFPEEQRHTLSSVGGVEVIGLGSLESVESLAPSAQTALGRLQTYMDGGLSEVFPDLKIYFADGVIDGGGEALAEENAVIIDAAKGKMSVAEAEDFLVGIGELDKDDWSKLAAEGVTYAEITIVHELGHILEARAHEQQGTAFAELSSDNAPTKYGRKAHNEDYAESFFYDVYGGRLESSRKTILQSDIQRIRQRAA
jgi:hypothetical protein